MMRRNWTKEEDKQLVSIVEEIGQSDWPTVSKVLQQHCQNAKSSKRTGKQCRERWYNQLNPSINKDQWTHQQEQKLFEVQKSYGNKWKQISRFLPGRTDNDIKNKFYSTLRRSLRRLNKLVGGKNSTGQIREIKPSVLATIINFVYANENANDELAIAFKSIPQLIFKFSNFKPVRSNMGGIVEEQAKQNIDFVFKLLQQFKMYYEKNKKIPGTISTENQSTLLKQEQSILNSDPLIKQQKSQKQIQRQKIVLPIITIFPPGGLFCYKSIKDMQQSVDNEMEAENQQSEGQNMLKREEDSKSLEGDVTSVMVLGHKLDCPKFTEQIERSEEIIEIHYD